MKTQNYVIHAIIQTKTPMHVADPEAQRYDAESGRQVFRDGIPLIGTQKLPLAEPIEYKKVEDGVEEKAFRQDSVPYVGANNIAGRLRRHAARLTREALKEKGETVTLTTYNAMNCGAATGNPDGEMVVFAELREASDHPFMGLFGGGPRMMRRRVRTHNMVPIMEKTGFMLEGFRHSDASDLQYMLHANFKPTKVIIRRRNDDLKELVDVAEQSSTITDFEAAITDYHRRILEAQKSGKDEGKSKVDVFSFSALEYIIPGVNFHTSFELMNVTEAQLGLFLKSLESFAETERIGGATRNGFGRIKFIRTELRAEHGETNEIFDANGKLNTQVRAIEDALAAWSIAAKELTAERMEYLCRLPKPKKAA